jgi:molybdate/tungstate transport system substrate-binding protein
MTLSIKVSPAKLAAIFIVTALVSAWAADTTVNVLYAGSLVNLMERSAGPAFEQKSGDRFQGYAGGSNKVANEIKGKLRRGDVFISANPKVDISEIKNGEPVSLFIIQVAAPSWAATQVPEITLAIQSCLKTGFSQGRPSGVLSHDRK